MHVLNLATFPHLDMSICPCQPFWRTFSSQTSPSGISYPMVGVPSMCPPPPINLWQYSTLPPHPCTHAPPPSPPPLPHSAIPALPPFPLLGAFFTPNQPSCHTLPYVCSTF